MTAALTVAAGLQACRKLLPPCRPADWACPGPMPPAEFAAVRRRMVLRHFKWDPQVGDVETLARFPLVLPADVVRGLAGLAEALAAETVAAEAELLGRPDLLRRLGLPRTVRRVLADGRDPPTPAAARVIRFDFHPTADGWRISEANSDVPGGYTEAGPFARLMAGHFPGCRPAGEPGAALAEAIHVRARVAGRVGLLAAPRYVEDQQVVAGLADEFRQLGWETAVGHPGQVVWQDGRAHLCVPGGPVALDVVFRFFQGEWLPGMRDVTRWRPFFRGGRTPVCNPGTALLAESKRFPLVWDELRTPLPTWRGLLPETLDPRAAPWRRDPDWLLKGTFSNNGDEVIGRGSRDWRKAAWSARLRPSDWVAQRRFAALPVDTPAGPVYPCLGVYTVDGRAAGVYGRLSPRPVIDYAAADVAVLVAKPTAEGEAP